MVWFNLQIQEHIAKYTPLKAEEKVYEYCDSEGNKLKYIKGNYTKGYYENDKGERFDKAFFLINNKPFDKLSKTKEVHKTKLVELNEVEDLILEHRYLMMSNTLLNYLIVEGMALKFGFSNGGKSQYIAYVYPSKLYKGFLFMDLGSSKISDRATPIIESIKEKQKAEELNITLQSINVEKLNVENLIEL
jgi:hypothetical protein